MNKLSGILSRITQGDARSVTVKKNIIFSFFLKGVGILTSLLLVPLTIGYVSPELYWCLVDSIIYFNLGRLYGSRLFTRLKEYAY